MNGNPEGGLPDQGLENQSAGPSKIIGGLRTLVKGHGNTTKHPAEHLLASFQLMRMSVTRGLVHHGKPLNVGLQMMGFQLYIERSVF